MRRLLAVLAIVMIATIAWLLWPCGAELPHASSPAETPRKSIGELTNQARHRDEVGGQDDPASDAGILQSPAPVKPWPLDVTVLRIDGTPAVGATVELRSVGGNYSVGDNDARGMTDVNGRVHFDVTTPADWTEKRVQPVAWLGEETAAGEWVSPPSGGTALTKVQMIPGVVIRGRAVDGDDVPVAGAIVRATVDRPSSSGWIYLNTVSRGDGTFELPTMDYEGPDDKDTNPSVPIDAIAAGLHPCHAKADLRTAEGRVVTLHFVRSGTLRGRFVLADGRAVPNRVVRESGGDGEATCDDDGRFALPLSPDAHDIVAFSRNARVEKPETLAETWMPPRLLGSFRGDAGDRDVGDVVLVNGRPVHGVVVDDEGNTADDAEIKVELAGVDVASTRTETNGAFELPALGAEQHALNVVEARRNRNWTPRTALLAGVHGGDSNVRIALAGGRAIIVNLLDAADRTPVSVVGVLTLREEGSEKPFVDDIDDLFATMRLEVPRAGSWDVTIALDGYEPATVGGVEVKSGHDGKADVLLRKKHE